MCMLYIYKLKAPKQRKGTSRWTRIRSILSNCFVSQAKTGKKNSGIRNLPCLGAGAARAVGEEEHSQPTQPTSDDDDERGGGGERAADGRSYPEFKSAVPDFVHTHTTHARRAHDTRGRPTKQGVKLIEFASATTHTLRIYWGQRAAERRRSFTPCIKQAPTAGCY